MNEAVKGIENANAGAILTSYSKRECEPLAEEFSHFVRNDKV
jgi:hypothetical protein